MRFSAGTLAALVAFLLAMGAGWLILTYTDWIGKDWRVVPIIGLMGYLVVRIVWGAFGGMRR